MYIDSQLLLAGTQGADNAITPQAVTGSSAVVSGNTADLRQACNVGAGESLFCAFQVYVAAAGGTAMDFQVIQADDAALTSNVTVIGSTAPVPVAQIKVGARFAAALNPRIANKGQRYLGARFVPTGTMTDGSYTAAIVTDLQDGQALYPSGWTVI